MHIVRFRGYCERTSTGENGGRGRGIDFTFMRLEIDKASCGVSHMICATRVMDPGIFNWSLTKKRVGRHRRFIGNLATIGGTCSLYVPRLRHSRRCFTDKTDKLEFRMTFVTFCFIESVFAASGDSICYIGSCLGARQRSVDDHGWHPLTKK